MSRILHLSDLHLGKPSDWQYLDAATKRKLAPGDRRAQKHVLLETIGALEKDRVLETIDAVVISGDLANRADPDGFKEFGELAEQLIRHVPVARILVVPGNHDVPKEHGPGDAARYERFVGATRTPGMATPLLDGKDFESNGVLTDEARSHPHVVSGDDFVLIPLNSSHFCWGTEPVAEDLMEELLTADSDKLEELVKELHQYDVARVSNAQMTALPALLEEDDLLKRGDDHRVRIGVLHHQLLPVSAREDLRDFESLTNLGAIRELLASLEIDIVLHGHKHESTLYWDYVPDQRALSATAHRMLVSAAPGQFLPGGAIARIVEVLPRTAARDVDVTDVVAATRRGGRIQQRRPQRARLWDRPSTGSGARVIRGRSVSETYAMVQSLFDGTGGEPLRYVVCEIEDARGAEKRPKDYPPPPGIDDVDLWMADLVEWWQLPDPRLGDGVEFNHGERIRRHWGDQAERAADLLSARGKRDPLTTRAVIVLVDPQAEASHMRGEFPSFVLVQLQLVQDGSDWRLDCTGYFRKQEMQYWWPINVAELAQVQRHVSKRVRIDGQHPQLGILRTVTAHAEVEERLPAVALPAVDRAVDQRPKDLWRMAYGLIEPKNIDDKTELRRVWERFLGELDPDDGLADELPRMSRRGLRVVLDMVESVGAADSGAVTALRGLVRFYKLAPGDPAESRTQAEEALAQLRSALDAELGKPSTEPS